MKKEDLSSHRLLWTNESGFVPWHDREVLRLILTSCQMVGFFGGAKTVTIVRDYFQGFLNERYQNVVCIEKPIFSVIGEFQQYMSALNKENIRSEARK